MTAPRFMIMGEWLVEQTGEHTCGAGEFGQHEPTCGLEPVLRLEELPEVLRVGLAVEFCHACGHRHDEVCEAGVPDRGPDGEDARSCGCPYPEPPPPPTCPECRRVIGSGEVHGTRNGERLCRAADGELLTPMPADPWRLPVLPHHTDPQCPELFAVTPGRDTCTCARPRSDEPPF